MLSLRATIICFLLKHRNLFKRDKGPVDWNTYEAILEFRKEVEGGAERFGKLPADIAVTAVDIHGMHAEWISPTRIESSRVMLYFHGGGYVSGTCQAHRSIVAKFVKASGQKALLFEYRLAPEHRFPAALDDALAAYQWLLGQGISPQDISFVGDSGGGGLELAALLSIRDKGLPLPSAVVAMSPYTDLLCTGESHQTNLKKCLAPEGTAQAFSKHYAGDADRSHPYISPLYGELAGLPRMLIFCGSEETLRDDSIRYAEKAKRAGVNVTLRVGEGLFHCYPATAPLFPEASQAMQEICEFINTRAAC